jgi:hypothetical protein
MRALLAVASLAAAAGCGGDDRLSKLEYERAIRALEEGKGAEAVRIYTNVVVEPLAQEECAAKAQELHDTLVDILDEVEDLRPPENVEALQREFLAAATESVDRVGELADEVDGGGLACGPPYNERVYGLSSTRRAQRVLVELEAMGYRLGRA